MMNYRCRCGKSTAFGSMPCPRCHGCEECGTTLEFHSSLWQTPEPHEWVPYPVETDAGTAYLTRCKKCGDKKAKGGEGK